ncbi:MAG: hypothetical protein GEV12_18945 [Micromonosporaceae bacterium]|nr:hypothetical protein [Micromonosporaceae bacterium]
MPEQPAFDPGPLGTPEPEPAWANFAPGPLSGRWGGRAWRQRREEAARSAYQRACDRWQEGEQDRSQQLVAAERAHQQRLAQVRAEQAAYQSRIARVAAGMRDRDPPVVESFLRTVLRRVPLPAGFPRRAEVIRHPDVEQVTLRVVVPGREVVPPISGYEYLAAADEVRPVPRSDESAAALYDEVVAQVALLVVRDVREAEPELTGVRFEGLIDTTAPDTSKPVLAPVLRFFAPRAELFALLPQDPGEPRPDGSLRSSSCPISSRRPSSHRRSQVDAPARRTVVTATFNLLRTEREAPTSRWSSPLRRAGPGPS